MLVMGVGLPLHGWHSQWCLKHTYADHCIVGSPCISIRDYPPIGEDYGGVVLLAALAVVGWAEGSYISCTETHIVACDWKLPLSSGSLSC